jgi:hypothetical protein
MSHGAAPGREDVLAVSRRPDGAGLESLAQPLPGPVLETTSASERAGRGCWLARPCTPRPVAVQGGLRFREIAAGSMQTCALDLEGRPYCRGLTGSTPEEASSRPVPVGRLSAIRSRCRSRSLPSVFVGRDEAPKYVRWSDVMRIDFRWARLRRE